MRGVVQVGLRLVYTEIMKAIKNTAMNVLALTLWAAGAWACAFAVFALLIILAA